MHKIHINTFQITSPPKFCYDIIKSFSVLENLKKNFKKNGYQ